VLSRKLLPIPNAFVQYTFGISALEGFDGELIVGEPNATDVYSKTYSGVMKATGEPDVTFHVFDHVTNPTEEYCRRYNRLSEKSFRWVEVVPQHGVMGEQGVLDIEDMYLKQGYEGVMLRAHSGPRSFYKYGRSTAKETTLLKLKRFTDSEAVIVGFQEQMFNGNEAVKDELGRTKRSSHAENKTGKGTLGALICADLETGVTFNIGTGFDDATKQSIWDRRDSLNGHFVKYKSFKIGVKDAPRFPVFLGFRSPLDMSA
jgi:DNA ligase-1